MPEIICAPGYEGKVQFNIVDPTNSDSNITYNGQVYQKVKILGGGGSACVFLYENLNEKYITIKKFSYEAEKYIIENEVAIWQALHPEQEICAVYDFCPYERIWLVMPYIVGETLNKVRPTLQNHKEVFRLSSAIAKALVELHDEKHIIHKDVLMFNILINAIGIPGNRSFTAFFCDFGTSRFLRNLNGLERQMYIAEDISHLVGILFSIFMDHTFSEKKLNAIKLVLFETNQNYLKKLDTRSLNNLISYFDESEMNNHVTPFEFEEFLALIPAADVLRFSPFQANVLNSCHALLFKHKLLAARGKLVSIRSNIIVEILHRYDQQAKYFKITGVIENYVNFFQDYGCTEGIDKFYSRLTPFDRYIQALAKLFDKSPMDNPFTIV